DQTDKSDGTAERRHRTRQNGPNEIREVLEAAHVDAARGRPFFAGGKRIELRSDEYQSNQTSQNEWGGTQNRAQIRSIQSPHHPPCHQITLIEIGGIVNEHDQRAKNKIQCHSSQKQSESGKSTARARNEEHEEYGEECPNEGRDRDKRNAP